MSSDGTPQADEEQRILTAVHEAGHVVTMFLFGLPFTSVTIQPGEDMLGSMYTKGGWVKPEGKGSVRWMRETIVMLLAGELAERRYRAEEHTFLIAVADDPTADSAKVHHLLSERGPVGELEAGILIFATTALLDAPMIWRAVEAVRDALLDRATLAYDDVRTILDGLNINDLWRSAQACMAFADEKIVEGVIAGLNAP